MQQHMDDTEQHSVQRACEALVTRYTHIADFGPGAEMADIFTEDGVWTSGAETYHGSSELRESAVSQLQKLGELIKRHPNSTFVIEGHTDSTGTPETNQALSQERAGSVKQWLVDNMGIAPERIETLGLGSSKLIVPPQAFDMKVPGSFDAEVARQQPNRRVEIVIKTNRK